MERGLTPHDFDARTQFFSSNYKAPPKMTPYWRLFLNALDDFMLKFLSVCAVVQLVIEVSFADASHRSTCKYMYQFAYNKTPTQISLNSTALQTMHNTII